MVSTVNVVIAVRSLRIVRIDPLIQNSLEEELTDYPLTLWCVLLWISFGSNAYHAAHTSLSWLLSTKIMKDRTSCLVCPRSLLASHSLGYGYNDIYDTMQNYGVTGFIHVDCTAQGNWGGRCSRTFSMTILIKAWIRTLIPDQYYLAC